MTRQPKGRRPLTCHHEAGHALVRWYFGHATDRAVVLTVAEVRAGVMIVNRRGAALACEGAIDGYDICDFPFGPIEMDGATPEQQAEHDRLRVGGHVELIHCAAGIAAEAAYRRKSSLVWVVGQFEVGACEPAGSVRPYSSATIRAKTNHRRTDASRPW